MVSSTLVNVSEDAEARLIHLLCESSANNDKASLQQECSTYLSKGNIYKLLTTLISSSSTNVIDTLVLHMEPITEVVTMVMLLSNMIQRLDSTDTIKEVLSLLVNEIARASPTATTENVSIIERKVTILSVLYNMMDTSYKCMLLERMILLIARPINASGASFDDRALLLLLQPDTTLGQLISSPISSSSSNNNNNNTILAQPPLPPIVNMLQSWNVSDTELRSLYTSISNVLPSDDIRQQRFLLLLIESYSKTTTTNETTIINDDIIKLVKQVTINAIRDPITLFRDQRNLLSQSIVQQTLQKHDTALLALLTVFQEGTMSEYEQFIAKHAGSDATATATLFLQWGLDQTECVRYMRIFSLCTLAIGKEVITYAEIRKALHWNDGQDDCDDIESWVIAAVNCGLLQAKMDQLQEMVMIERCVVRKFDVVQWKNVQSKLISYKEQVGTVLNTLKQQQLMKQQ